VTARLTGRRRPIWVIAPAAAPPDRWCGSSSLPPLLARIQFDLLLYGHHCRASVPAQAAADAVIIDPEVRESARLEAAFRLGDSESLQRLQQRCADVSTRPAGWSAILDAGLPDTFRPAARAARRRSQPAGYPLSLVRPSGDSMTTWATSGCRQLAVLCRPQACASPDAVAAGAGLTRRMFSRRRCCRRVPHPSRLCSRRWCACRRRHG
jgi:hypothetical protein